MCFRREHISNTIHITARQLKRQRECLQFSNEERSPDTHICPGQASFKCGKKHIHAIYHLNYFKCTVQQCQLYEHLHATNL